MRSRRCVRCDEKCSVEKKQQPLVEDKRIAQTPKASHANGKQLGHKALMADAQTHPETQFTHSLTAWKACYLLPL